MKLDPRRLRILRDLDVEAVRPEFVARVGEPLAPDAIEASLHKARLVVKKPFTSKELNLSRRWLRAHGYEVPA